MFGDYPPDAENILGARWNPPGVAAIYTSLTREGALAEAEHQIAIQPHPAACPPQHLHARGHTRKRP
jgi:RES domain-containing protein